jgi:O-antigen/teichoic acid export membrane protein
MVGGGLIFLSRTLSLIDVPPLTLEVAVLGALLATFQALFLAVLNGQHRLSKFAGLSAGIALATAAGSVGVLALGGGLLGMLVAIQVVMIVACVYAWRSLDISLDWTGARWSELRSLAIAGLPFAGMSVVLRLRGDSEVMLLGIGLSVEVLGWWAAAERISYIALFVPTLLATPLLPALSSVASDLGAFRDTLRRSLDLTIILTVGASSGIAAVAPAVPQTLGWGQDFAAAVPFIELLSMVAPLVSVGIVLGTALIALGVERRWFVVSAIASSLHLVVTPAAIVAFNALWGTGGVGAATAKLLIEALMICGALYLLPRGTVSVASGVVALKTCFASAIMVVAVRFVLSFEWWLILPLAIGVGGLVFLTVLAALRIVPPSEVTEVLGFVRQTIGRRRG